MDDNAGVAWFSDEQQDAVRDLRNAYGDKAVFDAYIKCLFTRGNRHAKIIIDELNGQPQYQAVVHSEYPHISHLSLQSGHLDHYFEPSLVSVDREAKTVSCQHVLKRGVTITDVMNAAEDVMSGTSKGMEKFIKRVEAELQKKVAPGGVVTDFANLNRLSEKELQGAAPGL